MKNQVILCAFSTLLLGACAKVYKPPTAATPLFTEKNQIALEGSYSRAGINFSAAASVSPQLAVMFNGQYNNGTQKETIIDKQPASGSYGEFGIGYFKKVNDNFIFETYGGYGLGKLADTYQLIDKVHEESFKYNKVFLQPNLDLKTGPVDFIFTPRFAYVFGNYTGDLIAVNGVFNPDLSQKINFFSAEPTLTIAMGNEKLKGFMQGGMTFNKYSIITSSYNIGGGIKYKFSTNFAKK